MSLTESTRALQETLRSTGYVCDDDLATIVRLATEMQRPLLLEGEPGTGKTSLAEAIAAAVLGLVDPGDEAERLQAAIESSQTFIPGAFWESYAQHRDQLLPSYETELAAIRDRDCDSARRACAHRADVMAGILLNELVRRGVLCGTGRPATLH